MPDSDVKKPIAPLSLVDAYKKGDLYEPIQIDGVWRLASQTQKVTDVLSPSNGAIYQEFERVTHWASRPAGLSDTQAEAVANYTAWKNNTISLYARNNWYCRFEQIAVPPLTNETNRGAWWEPDSNGTSGNMHALSYIPINVHTGDVVGHETKTESIILTGSAGNFFTFKSQADAQTWLDINLNMDAQTVLNFEKKVSNLTDYASKWERAILIASDEYFMKAAGDEADLCWSKISAFS